MPRRKIIKTSTVPNSDLFLWRVSSQNAVILNPAHPLILSILIPTIIKQLAIYFCGGFALKLLYIKPASNNNFSASLAVRRGSLGNLHLQSHS